MKILKYILTCCIVRTAETIQSGVGDQALNGVLVLTGASEETVTKFKKLKQVRDEKRQLYEDIKYAPSMMGHTNEIDIIDRILLYEPTQGFGAPDKN